MLFDSLKSDPKSWIYSLVLGGIIYYVVKFYYKVKQYPSGPFPLPLIGSIYSKILVDLILIENANKNLFYYFNEIQHEKGDETFAVSQSPLPPSMRRPKS